MRECEQDILEQYDIDIKSTKKVRDGFLCETDKGLMLLKELVISEKRLPILYRVGEHLKEQGCRNVDTLQMNREGELFCVSEDGTRYFMKRWFAGRECDVKKENDLKQAVHNLAIIHQALQVPMQIQENEGNVYQSPDLEHEFFRHNRELRKVRTFIREKVGKGSFEQEFLKSFDSLYEWAECALERLRKSNYQKLRQESHEKHTLIHGDYNYHNVIIMEKGIGTTNFEHLAENIQVTDFYYFFRKTMEKNHWDISLGNRLIEQYQKKISISSDEMEYISICIAYPEKFWKAANSYYRSRKVWLPAKNIEKLQLVIRQAEEKRKLLEILFSFYI